MTSIQNMFAQGDILVRRVSKLPEGVKPVAAVQGAFIIGHSESGHHHVIEDDGDVAVFEEVETPTDRPKWLYAIIEQTDKQLKHLKNEMYAHQPQTLKAGNVYEFRRARERSPEGWRRAAD